MLVFTLFIYVKWKKGGELKWVDGVHSFLEKKTK
jgi:hypothetical protein